MKYLLLAFLLLFSAQSHAAANDEAALERGAAKGDATAIYAIAQRYFLKAEYPQALDGFKKAAKARDLTPASFSTPGVQGAKCMLGDMYATGRGVKRDGAEAAKWWGVAPDKRAALQPRAEKGDAAAQLALGDLYAASPCRLSWRFKGKEATMRSDDRGLSYDVALGWYKKSAAQGNATAQQRLGRGQGFPLPVMLGLCLVLGAGCFAACKKKPAREYLTFKTFRIFVICFALFTVCWMLAQNSAFRLAVPPVFILGLIWFIIRDVDAKPVEKQP